VTYLRLFIVSARDAVAQHEIEQDLCELREHVVAEAGCQSALVLSQNDGLTVGFMSVWTTQEDAVRFDASGLNSLYTTVIELRMAGDVVVKLFRVLDRHCERRPQ
jgi:hypothetical protein